MVPYTLNSTLFFRLHGQAPFHSHSRGLVHWIYRRRRNLDFPEGTLIAKTFAYARDLTDPSQGEQLLETRIEVLQEGEWYGYSYRWNEEQNDAVLTSVVTNWKLLGP